MGPWYREARRYLAEAVLSVGETMFPVIVPACIIRPFEQSRAVFEQLGVLTARAVQSQELTPLIWCETLLDAHKA